MFGIDLSLADPNLIYLVLLSGLWLGVFALYLPGTWLPELISVLLILGSLFVMAALPVSWLALGVLIAGVSSFLLLPFFGAKWGRYAEIGLILQAIGGFFLFTVNPVSPITIAVTVLLGLAYNRLVLVPVMQRMRQVSEYGQSLEVIGLRGRVVKDLNPVGTVYVNKELWRARSNEPLERDAAIRVITQDGLELIVEKAKNEDAPAYKRDVSQN